MRKIYAELFFWTGETNIIEIPEEFIQDVVDAVEGQFTFIDNEKSVCIRGEQISAVNIYSQE